MHIYIYSQVLITKLTAASEQHQMFKLCNDQHWRVFDVCINRSPSVWLTVVWLHVKDRTDNQADLQNLRLSEARNQLDQRFEKTF